MIYIDIDGVCADFITAALKKHRKEIDWSKHEGEYDLAKILKISNTQFWSPLNSIDFWTSIKPYKSLYKFLDELYKLDQDLYFVTSPAQQNAFYLGRYIWFKDNIKLHFDLTDKKSPQLIIIKDKHLLVNDIDDILIDDNDSNIKNWNSAGGIGILFPQYWNDMWENADLLMSRRYSDIIDRINNREENYA